jgi:hypothetical protein
MLVDMFNDTLQWFGRKTALVDYRRYWRVAVLPQQMYGQCRAKAFCVQAASDTALAEFLPSKQSNLADH